MGNLTVGTQVGHFNMASIGIEATLSGHLRKCMFWHRSVLLIFQSHRLALAWMLTVYTRQSYYVYSSYNFAKIYTLCLNKSILTFCLIPKLFNFLTQLKAVVRLRIKIINVYNSIDFSPKCVAHGSMFKYLKSCHNPFCATLPLSCFPYKQDFADF